MLESTHVSVEASPRAQGWFDSVTVEACLYGLFALLALGMRLLLLGNAPLSASEAQQALAAWHWINGNPDPYTGSPLLFSGNAILFALFGASDANARFIPMLFGSALVLLPSLLREELGRVGALITSFLLCFSPSLVLFSRETDGAIIAVTCGASALIFAWKYVLENETRYLSLAAVATALGFLAAREIWTIVLAVGVYVLIRRLRARKSLKAVSEDVSDGPVHAANVMRRQRDWRWAGLLFLIGFIGVGTTGLMHRDGIGAAFDLFGAWINGLKVGTAFYDPLRLLILYEPIALLFGGAAILDWVFSWREREETPAQFLSLWVILSFVLYTVGADKTPARIVVLVVPLLLAAGWYLGVWVTETVDAAKKRASLLATMLTQEVPVFAFGCALCAFLYIVLAEFAIRGSVVAADFLLGPFGGSQSGANSGLYGIVMTFLIAVVIGVIAMLAVSTVGRERARAVGIALAFFILTLWTIRQASLVNFAEMLNPQELLVQDTTPDSIRKLVGDLEDISRWRANDSHTLTILVDDTLGPAIRWYLRDFGNAHFVPRPSVTPGTEAVLLPADAQTTPSGFMSQLYAVRATRAAAPQPNLLRWLIFRDTGNSDYTYVALWIPQPQ